MRSKTAVVVLMLTLFAGCETYSPTTPTLPPAPPADVAAACASPELAEDWARIAASLAVALVECRAAAHVNAMAWRLIASPH